MRFAILLLACLAAQGQEKAGWISLFDGKTMQGWNDPARKNPPGDAWSIEDGCLKAKARPRIDEDLVSTRKFRDFELMFDWRISPRGNSGVKYRIQKLFLVAENAQIRKFEDLVQYSLEHPVTKRPDHGQEYVAAFEYQVIDLRNSDALNGGIQSVGALYDMVAPSSMPVRPQGEFNQSRIVLKGNHVEHWLNGVKVVDAELDSPQVTGGIAKRWGTSTHMYTLLARQPVKDCPISLQNHGNEAWFRNIRIRELR